jgi:DsbC/DsbD-like thiol-disulfide interchange protein/cytochrome c biogenesis protein CcdA/thiol-disulfide isomerase/thioredoxin
MRFFAVILALAALLFSGEPTRAQSAGQLPSIDIHVHAGLEAETLSPAAGSTVTLAITMRPDAGWHGYWSNPGDAGEGLSLEWKLPDGTSVGPPRFPVPETLIISGFMNYVYENPHAVLVDLKLPDGLAAGTEIPVSVEAYWLACTDRVCVPQQGSLATKLVIGDGRIATADRSRFDAWRAMVPVPLDREAVYAVTGKHVEIAIPYPASAAIDQPYFFPAAAGLIDHVAPQKLRRTVDWLVIETALSPALKEGLPGTITGLFRISENEGLLITARSGKVPSGGVAVAGTDFSAGKDQAPSLVWLLLGALLGGVLLNIMPCVFPILGLKALALAKAGGDERRARADALAYSAGVVLSCIALGAIMLLLRAGGEEVGWAFQLQEPGFVLFLSMLMVAITANLLGLFEFGNFAVGDALTRKPGLMGSFWTGTLAAIVATPCTGPFMAAALGAALLLPAVQAVLLFAALGVGIALPFLAIAYVPALRARLPRPGPWLAKFRKAMAVPMGLTALALLWLLWRLTGETGLLIGVVSCALLLAIAILNGPKSMAGRKVGAARVLGTLLMFGLAVQWLPTEVPESSASNRLQGAAFSEAQLNALRSEGAPVFVYFTADWCVSCKVNEATVLENDETVQLFAAKGVKVLRGDFTRRDPAIARFLSSQGAAGVPLYLYYPSKGEGQKLPQILTHAILRDAITG